MRILIYGECGDYGTGAWCYYQTFKQLGHEVMWMDTYEGIEHYQKNLIWKAIRKLNARNPIRTHLQRHNQILLDKVEQYKPHMVIILKGLFVFSQTIKQIKSAGVWIVNINHDDFFSFNPNNYSQIQRDALADYHHIFTTREVNVNEVIPYNPHVSFFPFAYYPGIHRVIELPDDESNAWKSDVLFVGTWEKERASLLEELVVSVPATYAIYGSQWEKVKSSSPLFPFLKKKLLKGDDMAHAIRYARMSLGFLRKENRDDYTQRTFEIPACGGLLLAERTARHQSFYKENSEAVFFEAGNTAELAGQIRWLMNDPLKAESIRQAGITALINGKHTYAHRIQQLLDIYGQTFA